MLKRYSQTILFILRAMDIAVVFVAWAAAYFIRIQAGNIGLSQHPVPPLRDLLSPVIFSIILVPLVFGYFGLYQARRTRALLFEVFAIARAVTVTWILMDLFVNFTRSVMISRLFMISLLVTWIVFAVGFRLSVKWLLSILRTRGFNQRCAAIIGTGKLAQKLLYSIRRNSWTGIEVKYFIDDSSPRKNLLGLNVLGEAESIKSILDRRRVDIVFVALPSKDSRRIDSVLAELESTDTDVKYIPDLLSYRLMRHDTAQLDELSIISLTHSPYYDTAGMCKRLIDVIISTLALIIAALPMLLIAAVIKLTSSGPVFYTQSRSSMGGRTFKMMKFRTMSVDAEKETGAVWAKDGDSRVTPVGKFLRRTSLDELPQLFNVLLGQMSLVGPRPERPELIERFQAEIPGYIRRGRIHAGMTGWAQINGFRGNTSLRKRIQYDLYYIRNWSIGLDVWILFVTIFRGFINKNAY